MKSLSRTQEKRYYFFTAGVLIWCLLIFLAPYLASREQTFASGMIYFSFSKVCHQMSSRSFFVFGHQLAVCSRCTGIYLGFLFSTLLFFILVALKKVPNISSRFLYLALVILIVDFSSGFTDIGNTLFSRFFTGFFVGAIALFFVLPAVLSWNKFLPIKKTLKNGE